MLFVAQYAVRHHLVCEDLPSLPTATDSADPHTANSSSPCASICKNAYGHHASPHLWRLQVHCKGLLHSLSLTRIHAEMVHTLSEWIYQDILCWWGTLSEIITDNGPAFVKACEQLLKKYHINHIHISGYNS